MGFWVLVTLLCVVPHNLAFIRHPCRPDFRQIDSTFCLQRIQSGLFNENEFFFGKKLDAVCNKTAQNNPDDVNCYVGDGDARKYSIASRLFPADFRADVIDRYLTVTFKTSGGTYKACGGSYLIDKRTTDINPDMEPVESVYMRNKPTFSMKTDPNTYYTILIVDAAYGFVHGYYTRFPEFTKEVIAYRSPYNIRNVTNLFLFIVYKQAEKDYLVEPMVLRPMETQGFGTTLTLDEFAKGRELVGPVAVNWMLVKRDPWSVQQVATLTEQQGGWVTAAQNCTI